MVVYTQAIVRRPCTNFKDGITEADLGMPDHQLSLMQHDAYCRALERCGLKIVQLPPDPGFPDSCFVEDTAVIADGAAVITRLGHITRRGEEKSIASTLSQSKQLLYIKEPGTVDGGDVMRMGDHYIIGLSQRTNSDGARQLASFLASLGKSATTVQVERFIHLKTYVSSVEDEILLCLEGYINPDWQKAAKHLISVPPEEHWAANCLGANGKVLVPASCPKTSEALEKAGKEVLCLDMSEFQKMDGRLTCLSILL